MVLECADIRKLHAAGFTKVKITNIFCLAQPHTPAPKTISSGNPFAARLNLLVSIDLINILEHIDPNAEFNKSQNIEALRTLQIEVSGLQHYSAKFTDDTLEQFMVLQNLSAMFLQSLAVPVKANYHSTTCDLVHGQGTCTPT